MKNWKVSQNWKNWKLKDLENEKLKNWKYFELNQYLSINFQFSLFHFFNFKKASIFTFSLFSLFQFFNFWGYIIFSPFRNELEINKSYYLVPTRQILIMKYGQTHIRHRAVACGGRWGVYGLSPSFRSSGLQQT